MVKFLSSLFSIVAATSIGFSTTQVEALPQQNGNVQSVQIIASVPQSRVYVVNNTSRPIKAFAGDVDNSVSRIVPAYGTVYMGSTDRRYASFWAVGAGRNDTRYWRPKHVDTGRTTEDFTFTFNP